MTTLLSGDRHFIMKDQTKTQGWNQSYDWCRAKLHTHTPNVGTISSESQGCYFGNKSYGTMRWKHHQAVKKGPENSGRTPLANSSFSKTTSRSRGSTHIWQTDGGREADIPFGNSIPVESLGRTENAENKHSLWLRTYNCSFPNNSFKKKVVDAVGHWIFFLFLFF